MLGIYEKFGKRILDVVLAATGLLLLLPVLGVISAILCIRQGRPIFFRQHRPGLNRKIFNLTKFRTMSDEIDSDGELLPDAKRLTGIGTFLRRTSLDEVPELWNVLCGEMSIVGPRPLLVEYLDRYTPEQMRRHEVRPGITGWAQINGRQSIAFSERLRFDVWYVDNLSLLLDLIVIQQLLGSTPAQSDR